MAKTASPLAYGILGLLSGFGQSLLQRQEQQREDIKAKTKREQDIADREDIQAAQESQFKRSMEQTKAEAAATEKYRTDTLAEQKRSNLAQEGYKTELQNLKEAQTKQDVAAQGRINELMLRLLGAEQTISLLRLGDKGQTPQERRADDARDFISKAYTELLKNPIYTSRPEKLQGAVQDLSIQALRFYGTTGNEVYDKELLKQLLGAEAGNVGNKGAAAKNTPAQSDVTAVNDRFARPDVSGAYVPPPPPMNLIDYIRQMPAPKTKYKPFTPLLRTEK